MTEEHTGAQESAESQSNIADHYTSGQLWQRIQAGLIDDGADPQHPTIKALAPYDQFHGRGLEATEDIAGHLSISANDHILDIGSGIGGPARYFARRFNCQVTGIDLTAEFCDVARHLNDLTGLAGQVTIEQGDALAMPFTDASFDGAYSMNVAMNIADKAAFYREIHRVLRPGGWLVLVEIAQGPESGAVYPTPWARTAASSFLATPEQTRTTLESNGFKVQEMMDSVAQNLAFASRSKAAVERGEKAPHRAVPLIHGELAPQAAANSARGVREKQFIPIEIFCVRNDG